jgi:hypothetical protein
MITRWALLAFASSLARGSTSHYPLDDSLDVELRWERLDCRNGSAPPPCPFARGVRECAQALSKRNTRVAKDLWRRDALRVLHNASVSSWSHAEHGFKSLDAVMNCSRGCGAMLPDLRRQPSSERRRHGGGGDGAGEGGGDDGDDATTAMLDAMRNTTFVIAGDSVAHQMHNTCESPPCSGGSVAREEWPLSQRVGTPVACGA